jgi:mannosyl-oligosaccharide alpha-1,2-mannosidase
MYRITGEQQWRDVGWKMFQAIDKATRTDIAHAAIHDVTVQPGARDQNRGPHTTIGHDTLEKGDSMESFCEYLILSSVQCGGIRH